MPLASRVHAKAARLWTPGTPPPTPVRPLDERAQHGT